MKKILLITFLLSFIIIVSFQTNADTMIYQKNNEEIKQDNKQSVGITFTFDNDSVKVVNDTVRLVFDIMIQASDSGSKFGDAMVYVDYNTDAFGENICAQNNIHITRGDILLGDFMGYDLYELTNFTDNTSSRFAVTTSFIFPALPDIATELPAQPVQFLHISLVVNDTLSTSGLSFQQNLMSGQIYYSDNTTLYDPVIADDTLDIVLIPQPEPLSPPENVLIEIIGTDVQVSWDQVSGASSYSIYSSLLPDTGFTLEASGIIDTDWSQPIPANKKFYFVVSVN